MKYFISVTLISILLISGIGCSKKITPTTSVTEQTNSSELHQNVSAEEVAFGKTIYNQKCGRCHRLYAPDEFSMRKWDKVLPVMFQKAHLDTAQQRLVRAYVTAGLQP